MKWNDSLQWLQNPQERKQRGEQKEDEVRRCPKPRVTRGKRVWWEHRLSWMLIAPSVSVLEAPIDAIDFFFFLFLFFSSHLETSCFLNWMNFKVMVAHLKSENWGFSHSLPLSWVVGVIHSNSEFTSWSKLDDLSSLYLTEKKKPHQPGSDFPRAYHSVTDYPFYEVSRSFASPVPFHLLLSFGHFCC